MERKNMPKKRIKGKLISTVSMLALALIMVVSSTFAWFTLSTAPEVTGVTSAIGANGALEMRLNGAAVLGDTNENTTFGNIVELLNDNYGLQHIKLLPSTLNLLDENTLAEQFLIIPTYGDNGKKNGESANSTVTGIYNGENFKPSDELGVRAVGVASGFTPRQLAYHNAKYAASTNATLAKNKATVSLNSNGSALGNIVIKKVTVEDATYTKEDVASLLAIIGDLQGTADTIGVLQYIEAAYEQMMIGYAASSLAPNENLYAVVQSRLESDALTISDIVRDKAIVLTVNSEEFRVDLTDNPILECMESLENTKANVQAAKDTLELLDSEKNEYEWLELRDGLQYLINMEHVKLNNLAVSGSNAPSKGELIESVLNEGVNLQLASGAGVYSEIADHCGNYSATVKLETDEFGSITANMAAETDLAYDYLKLSQTFFSVQSNEPKKDGSVDTQPMTDFYGYIIDLVFRTNASNSNLLLQTEAVDRLYSGNNNENTQGSGSSMTFQSKTSDFTTEQVKRLMGAIRIVFFDTHSREIYAYAKLDIENASVGSDGVTASMYLYEKVDYYTYTDDEGEDRICYVDVSLEGERLGYVYYSDEAKTVDITDEILAKNPDAYIRIPKTFVHVQERKLTNTDEAKEAVITALPQNEEVEVSTLVYLEGIDLENKDVAATNAESVSGKMNLQFSSSSDLVPMEYGDLRIRT